MDELRVMVVGLGPIGCACAQAVHVEKSMTLTGMVDVDASRQDLSLGELQGRDDSTDGPRVTNNIAQAAAGGIDVAIVATSSDFRQVAPTILQLLECGAAVVSSCEQMAWPWYRHTELARQVHAKAEHAGRAVLGSGVNPGFVMEILAVVLSTMLRRVTRVRCVRRTEAALRRKPLQQKVGVTLKHDDFVRLARQGKVGHQGLPESVALLAAGLGRTVEPDSVLETLKPQLADRPIKSVMGLIEPGHVCGIRNVARWQVQDLSIELDLTMAVGVSDPTDMIELDGPVPLNLTIPGSIPGDSATVAALLNHVRLVHQATPGLRTPLDMPPAGCRGLDA